MSLTTTRRPRRTCGRRSQAVRSQVSHPASGRTPLLVAPARRTPVLSPKEARATPARSPNGVGRPCAARSVPWPWPLAGVWRLPRLARPRCGRGRRPASHWKPPGPHAGADHAGPSPGTPPRRRPLRDCAWTARPPACAGEQRPRPRIAVVRPRELHRDHPECGHSDRRSPRPSSPPASAKAEAGSPFDLDPVTVLAEADGDAGSRESATVSQVLPYFG